MQQKPGAIRGLKAARTQSQGELLLLLAAFDLGEHVAELRISTSSPSIVISVPPYLE